VKYLIFTGSILNMGGAQMYVKNKTEYMRSAGWEVYVFSGLEGTVMLGGLMKYKDMIIPELDCYPDMISDRKKKQIIKLMMNIIDVSAPTEETIIIESNTLHMSCWAEMLAEKLRAKHYMFLLDEHFNYGEEYYDFIEFKYKRSETAVIKGDYIRALLKNRVKVDDPSRWQLNAFCTNVVEDIKDERFDHIGHDEFDCILCSLGRLNKSYIPNVAEGFEKFAAGNPDKKICCVFIGDQPVGYTPDMNKLIERKLSGLKNVTLLMMGYVYPIPESFLRQTDVAVAVSGSASVLWSYGVKTITMDVSDNQPIGVLGYTTKNNLNRDGETVCSLDIWLERIVNKNYLSDYIFEPKKMTDASKWFEKHMEFAEKSCREKEYYNMYGVRTRTFKKRLKKILICIFGVGGSHRIVSSFKNLFDR